jgi:hypothetical protein
MIVKMRTRKHRHEILRPLLSIEDPDTFFFMRGFPDRASLMPMIEKYDVVFVDDPTSSIRF